MGKRELLKMFRQEDNVGSSMLSIWAPMGRRDYINLGTGIHPIANLHSSLRRSVGQNQQSQHILGKSLNKTL